MGKTQRNSIAKNILHLFYSTALSSVLNAAALIILAYYLQSHNYGLFSVALAFAMIMGYFTDAGLSDIVLREGSKNDVDVPALIASYIKLRAVLMIATFLFGFLFINLTYDSNPELIKTAYFLIIPMVIGIAMQSIGTTFFQLIEKMQYYGAIRIISAFMLISTVSLGMIFSLNPYVICFLYGFSYFSAGLIGVLLVRKTIKIPLRSQFHRGILHGIGSFTIGGLLFVILPHLGTLILEKTLTLTEVGLFAVAYRIPQALQQLPYIVAGAFYPVLFRNFNSLQLKEHLRLSTLQIKVTVLLGAAITVPVYHMSDTIVTRLFGEGWINASAPLKVLALMLILQSVSISLADGLTTRGLQFQRTLIQFLALIIGAVLYFSFSELYGVVGAAFAGITIETIALFGFWLMIPNRYHLAVKAIVPYLIFIAASIFAADYLLHSFSILAAGFNLLILSVVIIADKELYGNIKTFVAEKWKRKQLEGKEAGHGI